MGQSDRDGALSGWKAIAAFFGRDERTVKRWEITRGLPIRRVPGQRAPVWADVDELRRWRSGEPAEAESVAKSAGVPPLRRGWLIAAACALVLVVGLGLLILARPRFMAAPADAYAGDRAAQTLYAEANLGFESRTPAGLGQAARDLTTLTRRRPDRAEGFAKLADCYLLLREFGTMPEATAYDLAERAAFQALALDPRSASALRALGFSRFYGHGDPAALTLFQRAEAIDPNSAQTHHWYANALSARGRHKQALDEFARAQALDPRSVAIAADKARVLAEAGDFASARQTLTRAAADYPQAIVVHRALAQLHLCAHEPGAFLAESETEARLRGDNARLATLASARLAFNSGGGPALMTSLALSETQAWRLGRSSALAVADYWAAAGNTAQARYWFDLSRRRGESVFVVAPGECLLAALASDRS